MSEPARHGVGVIDAQHRELLARVRRLDEAIARGERREVESLLAFLRVYVVDHFAEEEHQMKASAFPGYGAHKAAHDQFIARFLELELQRETEGSTPWLAKRVQQVITAWLARHIRGLDVELERYLAARQPA